MSLRSAEVTAIAVHSFTPTEVDEIELVEGETVFVLQQQEDEWWLVKKGDLVGLIPSTHVSITSVMNTTSSNVLPSGWDSCVDEKTGEKFYFNEITGLTQWERPVLYNAIPNCKKLKLRRRGRLPTLSSGEESDCQRSVPKADLQRWKQLREAADVRIYDLRKVLTKNEKVTDVTKLDHPLRSLSSPLRRSSAMAGKKTLLSSKSRGSSGSDEEKRERRLSADMRPRDLRGPKKDKKIPSVKGRVLLAAINPSGHTSETSPTGKDVEKIDRKTSEKEKEKSRASTGDKSRNKSDKPGEQNALDKERSEGSQHLTGREGEREGERDIKDSMEIEEEQEITEDDCSITLPNCRTVVYPPTNTPLVSNGPPSSTLSLQYVRGYNGDDGTCSCKNVLYANNRHVVFPAAAVIVVMNTESSEQRFLIGHTATVISMTLHPLGTIIASGDASGLMLIWDIALLETGTSMSKSMLKSQSLAALEMEDGSSVQSLSFSSDGRLLVALTRDSCDGSQTITVYDWSLGNIVASALTEHSAQRVAFDPYRDYMTGGCTPAGSPTSTNPDPDADADADADLEYEACYSLISCGGRVVKFWTVTKQFDSFTDELPQQQGRDKASSYGCRKCTYTLEGRAGTWPGGEETAVDLTCFTFTSDRSSDSESPHDVTTTSRVLCGSSSGSIYIWQQMESHSKEYIGQKSPIPKGKLISLVTDVHDGAVCDIDYFNATLKPTPYSSPHSKSLHRQSGGSETVVTCGSDGVANLWELERVKEFPLEHICACSLFSTDDQGRDGSENGSGSGGDWGTAKCVSFCPDGRHAVVGTAGNTLLLLSLSGEEALTTLSADVLMSCHSDAIQHLAPQPANMSAPSTSLESHCFFATVSRDSTVRVWDSKRCLQVASIALLTPECVCFAPTGNTLAVCSSKGELFIVGVKALGANDSDASNDSEIILRKNIISKPLGDSNAATGDGSGLFTLKYSPDGKVLAVSCGDHEIHLLSVRNSYKRLGVCRGHTACVRGIDFSTDSRILQSFDCSSELMFWDVAKRERIPDAKTVRDVRWQSWCSPIGWSVQGVSNTRGPKKDVLPPPVCLSYGGSLLAAGGSALRLFNYPCLQSAVPSICDADMQQKVHDVMFLPGDKDLITISRSNSIIFQWAVG